MNVSSFDGKKFKNCQPSKKKQIPISISTGINPLFQQAKFSNIATSYKESSEQMRIQNIGKKKICADLKDISKKICGIASYYSNRQGIPNPTSFNTINTSSSIFSQRNPAKQCTTKSPGLNMVSKNNSNSVNSSYFPKNTITSTCLNESSTSKIQITSTKPNESNLKYDGNESKPANAKNVSSKFTMKPFLKEKQTTLTINTSTNSLVSSKTQKTCGKAGQVRGIKGVNINFNFNFNERNNQITNFISVHTKPTEKGLKRAETVKESEGVKIDNDKEEKKICSNPEEKKVGNGNVNVNRYASKKIIPTGNSSLSIVNMKQKYKELMKGHNMPVSIAVRKSFKLSIDSRNNGEGKKNQRGSSLRSKRSNGHMSNHSLTLHKDSLQSKNRQSVNRKKMISFPVPRNSNPQSTRNNASMPGQINLQSLIQDNCMTLKQANRLNNNNNNNNNYLKEKFSIEELENEVENMNKNYEITSNNMNLNSLEFDNFDDINTIIRKLQFDQIDIKKENIFSQDNFLYKNFEERFHTDFDVAINRLRSSGRKNVNNISLSTQDNSSKKCISPLNCQSGHELKYLFNIS